jgi:hypothetical protein
VGRRSMQMAVFDSLTDGEIGFPPGHLRGTTARFDDRPEALDAWYRIGTGSHAHACSATKPAAQT